MDDKGRESGHLMLITPERVFYAGLLGRPRERCQGASTSMSRSRAACVSRSTTAASAIGELLVVPCRTSGIPSPATTAPQSASLIEPESIARCVIEARPSG